MNVTALMVALKSLPPDAPVLIAYDDVGGQVVGVNFDAVSGEVELLVEDA